MIGDGRPTVGRRGSSADAPCSRPRRTEAADYAGYRSVSTLRKAAREGHLRVVRPSPHVILTTAAWVEDYELRIWGKGDTPAADHAPEQPLPGCACSPKGPP